MIQNYLNDKVKREKRDFKQLSWKIAKILIFLFFLVTSLWGCGQQIFDHSVMSFNSPGAGFEICINANKCINNHVASKSGIIDYGYITSFSQAIKLGPFYGLFVWPLCFLTSKISVGIANNNDIPTTMSIIFTILIIVLIIRGIITVFSIKQFKQQILMQKIQPKIAQIKAKYSGAKDMAAKQRMQMEIMDLNKKFGVNPAGALISTFITLPFFYSMYRVFSSLRIFKEGYFFKKNWKMVYSPFSGVFSHHIYIYLLIAALLIPIQIISFKLPSWLSKKDQKKIYLTEKAKKEYKRTQTITNVISIVFVLMAFELPTSIGIYWIFSGLYTIIQTILLWKNQQRKQNKSTRIFEQGWLKNYLTNIFNKINLIKKIRKLNIIYNVT